MISVQTPLPDEVPLVVDGLKALGGRVVDREGGRLVAYLPPPMDLESFLWEARATLRSRSRLPDLELRWEWRPRDRAWNRSRQELRARRITRRMVIAPPWDEPRLQEGQLLIRVDAGVTFGTGEHPTTRSCLRHLERVLSRGESVLDLGAGSGILGVAAARLGGGRVVAVEREPDGCEAIERNLALNGVEPVTEVRCLEVTPSTLGELGRFQGVLANLERPLLLSLVPELDEVVLPGGWLILSGVFESEADEMKGLAAPRGFLLVDAEVEEGWWSGLFRLRGDSGTR